MQNDIGRKRRNFGKDLKMDSWQRPTIGAKAILVSMLALYPTTSLAYQIDCAILLCLSGGWPASVECSAAKAEFIRRVTPFPIEPPLQIWRCPMLTATQVNRPSVLQTNQNADERNVLLTRLVRTGTRSKIDLSDPVFDFVRSLRVWHVQNYRHIEHGSEGECEETYAINLGAYSTQGVFSWSSDILPERLPHWMGLSQVCTPSSGYRGVGVEWSDLSGVHGYELIKY